MHALHRLHLAQATAIAAACAALALLLTLVFANTVNDYGSASISGSPAMPPTTVHAIQPGWNLDPFTTLLRSPALIPWTA